MIDEWRALFDADMTFTNGGGLQVQGFRLDIPGQDVDDAELGALLVRHLGLLIVGEVRISNKELIREAHKGSRDVGAATLSGRRLVELSHRIHVGLITYPGLPGPQIGDLARASDFLSIGTNDLTASILGLGRRDSGGRGCPGRCRCWTPC